MCFNNQIQSLFHGCYLVFSTKKWQPILPHAIMMKELKLSDSSWKILLQNARSLAEQHLQLKELIKDLGYNWIQAFSEKWLSKNHPIIKILTVFEKITS